MCLTPYYTLCLFHYKVDSDISVGLRIHAGCTCINRSSHRRCPVKKVLLKNTQYSWETPMLESLFYKFADQKTCNFIKKRLQHRCFPGNIRKFLEDLFWRTSARGCFYINEKKISKRGQRVFLSKEILCKRDGSCHWDSLS